MKDVVFDEIKKELDWKERVDKILKIMFEKCEKLDYNKEETKQLIYEFIKL